MQRGIQAGHAGRACMRTVRDTEACADSQICGRRFFPHWRSTQTWAPTTSSIAAVIIVSSVGAYPTAMLPSW